MLSSIQSTSNKTSAVSPEQSLLTNVGEFGFASKVQISPFIVIRVACLSARHMQFSQREQLQAVLDKYWQAFSRI